MTIKTKKKVLFIVISSRNDISRDNFLALQMPEIDLLAQADIKTIDYCDQPNKSIIYWQKVNQLIEQHYDDYDGFIIIKEPDSLIFAALATQTALIKNYKPIIFTTAPFQDGGFSLMKSIYQVGLRTNIINSLQLISTGLPETMIVYNQKVIAADHVKRGSMTELNAFFSIDDQYIAEIDLQVQLKSSLSKKHNDMKMVNKFCQDFNILYLHPGFKWADYRSILQKSKALIIKSNRQRGLTKYDYQYLQKYFGNKPIIIFNKLGLLNDDLPNNFVLASKMTWEDIVVRTMWCLAQTKETKKFKRLFIK
ncbi:MAG: asparaginase domain-containing protein [Candidatus Komeilibacteria bacterium]